MSDLIHQESRVYEDMRRVVKDLSTPSLKVQTAVDKSLTHGSGDIRFGIACLTDVVAE